jgi:eukaryotic-like serine/threonine-protein kinase
VTSAAYEPTMMLSATGEPAALADGRPMAEGDLVASRYRIEALLGEGGMGVVYRAHDTELDERVALKVLHGSDAGDEGMLERFRREVKLARKVTHPNVARTFDLGRCGDTRYITMELIEGTSLSRRLDGGPLSLAEALRITAEIARGLVAAHSAGVVHRDLKPDNVLLTPGELEGHERVVITDFGIARATERKGADERPESQRMRQLTVGGLVGTPAYMAPEQIVGETPDGRTDVFALGIVLFQLLSTRLPFEGDDAVAQATARLTSAPLEIRSLNDAVPEPVAELLASMLVRDRRDRPDARQALEALERLRGERPDRGADSVAKLGRVAPTTTQILARAAVLRVRTVAVLPIGSTSATHEVFARELGATLADGLARSAAFRVVPPAFASLGSGSPEADVVLTGSVRSEGERLRVNLRFLDPVKKTQRWAERFEGQATAPFSLEDTLLRAAETALRAIAGGADDARLKGPSDPAVRALYDRAFELAHRMNEQDRLEEALSLLRRAHELSPGDASVMSLLGLVLVRFGLIRRDSSAAPLIVEAEDWALRALNADSGLASTFVTLGLVRLHQGDVRASVRAFREALARDDRNAEASAYLGRFLVESGYLDEGIRRLELALSIEPGIQHAWWNLARAHALTRSWDRTEEVFRSALAATNNTPSLNIVRARVAFWRADPVFAAEVADSIEASSPPSHFVRSFVPPLRAFASGGEISRETESLQRAGASVASPALRAFWFQVEAEILSMTRHVDAALDAIDGAVALPFIDVGWMDHCPALDAIRRTGRFGQARAVIAARAESLWK